MSHSRGIYSYFCNGEAAGIEETWECEDTSSGRCISSVRYARPVGIVLRVDSIETAGKFQSCKLHWRRQLADGPQEISADYRFDNGGLTIFVHDGQQEVTLQDASENYVFSPLMRIYTGGVLQQLCAMGGSGQVLVPYIVDPEQSGQLLRPSWSQREALALAETSLEVDGRSLACMEYDYSGGEYPSGTRFWIDEQGVLLRYCWQQDSHTHWEVMLSDYERPA
ncbi:MAG: hypothetical protein ABJ308_04155 [Halieaceae bacterium]